MAELLFRDVFTLFTPRYWFCFIEGSATMPPKMFTLLFLSSNPL